MFYYWSNHDLIHIVVQYPANESCIHEYFTLLSAVVVDVQQGNSLN